MRSRPATLAVILLVFAGVPPFALSESIPADIACPATFSSPDGILNLSSSDSRYTPPSDADGRHEADCVYGPFTGTRVGFTMHWYETEAHDLPCRNPGYDGYDDLNSRDGKRARVSWYARADTFHAADPSVVAFAEDRLLAVEARAAACPADIDTAPEVWCPGIPEEPVNGLTPTDRGTRPGISGDHDASLRCRYHLTVGETTEFATLTASWHRPGDTPNHRACQRQGETSSSVVFGDGGKVEVRLSGADPEGGTAAGAAFPDIAQLILARVAPFADPCDPEPCPVGGAVEDAGAWRLMDRGDVRERNVIGNDGHSFTLYCEYGPPDAETPQVSVSADWYVDLPPGEGSVYPCHQRDRDDENSIFHPTKAAWVGWGGGAEFHPLGKAVLDTVAVPRAIECPEERNLHDPYCPASFDDGNVTHWLYDAEEAVLQDGQGRRSCEYFPSPHGPLGPSWDFTALWWPALEPDVSPAACRDPGRREPAAGNEFDDFSSHTVHGNGSATRVVVKGFHDNVSEDVYAAADALNAALAPLAATCPELEGLVDAVVSGRVMVLDGNRYVPLRDVQVRVGVDGVQRVLVNHTNETGYYEVRVGTFDGPFNYSVQANLVDRTSSVAVYTSNGTTSPLVRLRVPERSTAAARPVTDVLFTPWVTTSPQLIDAGGRLTDAHDVLGNATRLIDAAVFYNNTLHAYAFGRDALGVAYDHRLPVEVVVHDDGETCGACYYGGGSVIRVNTGAKSSALSANRPMNREYHEFGHHVHADSVMGGANVLPPLEPGDENHGGVNNSDSSDSVVEGFAEWYALLVANDSMYRWAGGDDDLEVNFHTYYNWDERHFLPNEEFNVAGLLWDLVDPVNASDRDFFALGRDATWDLLQDETVTTVRDIYLKLNATHGAQDTLADDDAMDIERLFAAHGFIADLDGDRRWGAGEPAGWADYFNSSTAEDVPRPAVRHTRYVSPASNLSFTARTADGADVAVARFQVLVEGVFPSPDGSVQERTVRRSVAPADGVVLIGDPPTHGNLTITPDVPGHETDGLRLELPTYWRLVGDALSNGSTTFLHHDFVLSPNGVARPTDVAAEPLAGGARITWTLPAGADHALVVRGADHAPRTPGDGVIVHDGRGTGVQDVALLGGIDYHYAVFAVDDAGRLSSGVEAMVTTASLDGGGAGPGSDGDGDGSGGAGVPGAGSDPTGTVLLLAVAALGAVGVAVWWLVRRR